MPLVPQDAPEKAAQSLLPQELRWTRWSYVLFSTFLVTLLILAYVWWPLAKEYLAQIDPTRPLWVQIDWLLLGIFALMSVLVMSGADMKNDAVIIGVGLVGGLVIESWGTQTDLWVYYTRERPPLWIIPAWPIASLSIDRLVRILHRVVVNQSANRIRYTTLYWLTFLSFLTLMLAFVWPTLDKSLTWFALGACVLLILFPGDYRLTLLTFFAGSGLGYFLERWGTTRLCWTYYSGQAPPTFAVFAHGMAAVAFWRANLLFRSLVTTVAGFGKQDSRKSKQTRRIAG